VQYLPEAETIAVLNRAVYQLVALPFCILCCHSSYLVRFC